MKNKIEITSKETEEQVLNDFLAGGDNRMSVLSKRYGIPESKVSRIIDKHFEK